MQRLIVLGGGRGWLDASSPCAEQLRALEASEGRSNGYPTSDLALTPSRFAAQTQTATTSGTTSSRASPRATQRSSRTSGASSSGTRSCRPSSAPGPSCSLCSLPLPADAPSQIPGRVPLPRGFRDGREEVRWGAERAGDDRDRAERGVVESRVEGRVGGRTELDLAVSPPPEDRVGRELMR